MPRQSDTAAPALVESLRASLAPDEFTNDAARRRRAACDAFFEGEPPLAVLTPRSIEGLATVVPRIAAADVAIVPQGATLSYSGGTLVRGRDWIAVDLTGLAGILEVNARDRFVRVQAGCGWARLHETLAGQGLRTPFWGPASGLHATIGGSLAADALFFGSARHGTLASNVLGLTVLLADGRLLRTGSLATGSRPSSLPFGPDLTRLFLGSCGAFGVIVEAVLPVIACPDVWRVAGFHCRSVEIAARVLAKLAETDTASEVILFDPAVTSALEGAAPSECLAPGRHAAPGASYSLSLAVEGVALPEVQLRLARALEACHAAGAQHVGEGLLGAFRRVPFQSPTMLRDARGRRWVPVHGLVAHSEVVAALQALDRCMARHADLVHELELEWSSTCALVGAGAVLVEANLYWTDAGNALIDHHLGPLDPALGAVGRWRRLQSLRIALAEALDALGAVHLQLGRFYDYRSRLDGTAGEVLDAFKRVVDPRNVMNPDVLGLRTNGERR